MKCITAGSSEGASHSQSNHSLLLKIRRTTCFLPTVEHSSVSIFSQLVVLENEFKFRKLIPEV